MITCAACGRAQPETEFDRRFIGKGTRMTCATCRGILDEQHKWQHAWEHRRVWEHAQREADLIWREQVREREEREQQAARWQVAREMAARRIKELGITDPVEWELTRRCLEGLFGSGWVWADKRRAFLELDPPYTGDPDPQLRVRRRPGPRVAQAVRERIYAQQGGRCYYCQRELLPLSVWRKGADGRSDIDRMPFEVRHNGADSGNPELDHKTPVTRGGTSALDNLAYACRRCNQAKMVRTDSEFRAYPHDAVTRLRLFPAMIAWMIGLEKRYPGVWDVSSPATTELPQEGRSGGQ